MSAKEMFEELGFEWKESKNYIEYKKYHYKGLIFKSAIRITFFKSGISKFYISDDYGNVEIDYDLATAIYKQFEEMEWKGF